MLLDGDHVQSMEAVLIVFSIAFLVAILARALIIDCLTTKSKQLRVRFLAKPRLRITILVTSPVAIYFSAIMR